MQDYETESGMDVIFLLRKPNPSHARLVGV